MSYSHVTLSLVYSLFNGMNDGTDSMIYKKKHTHAFSNCLIWSITALSRKVKKDQVICRVHDGQLSSFFSQHRTPRKVDGPPSCSDQRTVSKKKTSKDKICIIPRSQQLHSDKQFTLTMVLLAQQVFCGWKEHFHQFWNLPNDMNCTQRCLSTKKWRV